MVHERHAKVANCGWNSRWTWKKGGGWMAALREGVKEG